MKTSKVTSCSSRRGISKFGSGRALALSPIENVWGLLDNKYIAIYIAMSCNILTGKSSERGIERVGQAEFEILHQ